MMERNEAPGERVVQWLALAARLEGEGQYNLAKVMRAAGEGVLRRAAYEQPTPLPGAGLRAALVEAGEALATLAPDSPLPEVLARGVAEMKEGRLPLIKHVPHPYVCRTCGTTTLGEAPAPCPTCGARATTFKRFLPVYWLEALDPRAALAHLRETPEKVAALISGLEEATLSKTPPDGGWSIRNAVAHLRDAQGVLEGRVELMLAEDNPELSSQAVFSWATGEAERPPATAEIFAAYRASRQRTVARLEAASWEQWQRGGRHEEFGPVTVLQQASYFATHELTHLPQIEALRPSQSP